MVVVKSGVQFSFVCQVLEEIGRLQSRSQICFLQVLREVKSHDFAKSMEKTKQNRIKKCIIPAHQWPTIHKMFQMDGRKTLYILHKSYNYVLSTPTW